MVNETLHRIEDGIKQNDALADDKKQELLLLIGKLKEDLLLLATTHQDDARSIAGHAENSVREATRGAVDQNLLKNSLEGLSLSARRFEVSHSTLTGLINNIGHTLGNMGI